MVLYHELGHIIARKYNLNPDVLDNLMFTEAKKGRYLTSISYFKTDRYEFIAESIALTITKPDLVKKYMPNTYEVIVNLGI